VAEMHLKSFENDYDCRTPLESGYINL